MGVVIRWLDLPPIWLAALMAAGWGLDRAVPLPTTGAVAEVWLGGGLIGAALALGLWSALAFYRRRTSIIPGNTASALVTEGPYRLSRNPIYLADLMILAGFGLVTGSLWPILLTPLLALVLLRRFIAPEEAMLRREFPDAFAAWAARTRRWL